MPANTNQILFITAPTPQPITVASGTYIGAPFVGSLPIYYWVVARYPSGLAEPFGPVPVTGTPGVVNLNAQNRVVVSWQPVAGAISYDVIRGTTPKYPVPCSNCAVSLNNVGNSYTDTGAAGAPYPPPGSTLATASEMSMLVNNWSRATPYVAVGLDGTEATLPRVLDVPVVGNCAKFGANGTLVDSKFACSAPPVPDTASQPYIVIAETRLGPINNATLPNPTGFAFGNQGGTTLNQSQGSWTLVFPGNATSSVARYVASLPVGANWTLTAGFRCLTVNAGLNSRLGVGLREIATGRIVFVCQFNASNIQVANYTSDTVFASTSYDRPIMIGNVWTRIVRAGSALVYLLSLNGTDYIRIFSGTVTTFFTTAPDSYGVFGDRGAGAGVGTLLELFSLSIT